MIATLQKDQWDYSIVSWPLWLVEGAQLDAFSPQSVTALPKEQIRCVLFRREKTFPNAVLLKTWAADIFSAANFKKYKLK